MKFRGMHEELTNEILRECKKIDFDKALQFLTMPFADLMDSYGNGASLIGRIIGRVAVTKLLKELGETNKPAWVVVISYNLGNLESPHDNHLCYGTSKDLKQQFDELSKRMFLLSSIPCGQNHAYLKQIENSESDREHLKKEILDHHENHQQEEIQTPSIQIRWSRKGYSDSECNDSETNNSITIRATGSLSEDESEGDFEYQIISNSSWSSYFEKILQLCHHNRAISF